MQLATEIMGQKQAAYDRSGAIVAFYDSVDSPAPAGVTVIDIADAEWQAAISSPRPYAVVNGAMIPPAPKTSAELLAETQVAQKAAIDSAYARDVSADISFKTGAGVTQTFQADADSQMVLMQATQGYRIAGAVPPNFFWKAADNTLVAFTLADLEGLYVTVLGRGWAAFQKRATLKSQIDAATTVDAVAAITWA
jgi:hypothetical protein